ncbi:carboxylesterase family protein [Saccharothrix sp. MB29]|nr:carboxylesterase family protein [Saccharothrix sp. MB29]
MPAGALPGRPASDAEDCLYLNVTAKKHARKSPVLMWVHGGGLVSSMSLRPGPARRAATWSW